MSALRFIAAVWILLPCAASFGQQPFETLSDPQQQARYAAIIQEVRCLTCLNRSIAESDTPLARDLRREIRELIESGASDDEVVSFLTERYGDFVLYRPPLRPRTYALWAAPILFLGIGAIVFAIVLTKRLRQPIDDDEDEASDEVSA
ncbi:MAG: cytochrome c-type biogenesis protein CcmH [Gammaproteobacteria bacterium]|jgi:cytochrome c-type biogenesis protein CcmH